MTEAIGLWAALFPHAWLTLFSRDPQMLEAAMLYLRVVRPLRWPRRLAALSVPD